MLPRYDEPYGVNCVSIPQRLLLRRKVRQFLRQQWLGSSSNRRSAPRAARPSRSRASVRCAVSTSCARVRVSFAASNLPIVAGTLSATVPKTVKSYEGFQSVYLCLPKPWLGLTHTSNSYVPPEWRRGIRAGAGHLNQNTQQRVNLRLPPPLHASCAY